MCVSHSTVGKSLMTTNGLPIWILDLDPDQLLGRNVEDKGGRGCMRNAKLESHNL